MKNKMDKKILSPLSKNIEEDAKYSSKQAGLLPIDEFSVDYDDFGSALIQ